MRVVAVNGSPRKNGNTMLMLKKVLDAIGDDVDKELIWARDYEINPCDACFTCFEGDGTCAIKDDAPVLLGKFLAADAIVIGSPVYYGSVTPEVKTIIDRLGFLSKGRLDGKIGAPIVVARRWGHLVVTNQIVTWFHNMGMIVPGPGGGWSAATAHDVGDFEADTEGVEMARRIGVKTRYLLDRLCK